MPDNVGDDSVLSDQREKRRSSEAITGFFQSRSFRAACRDYRLSQEFITLYTLLEQNGVIERFFRSLKEECAWQFNFGSFPEAKKAIAQWIVRYNSGGPHQSLGYKSPKEYRAQEQAAVA
jgi:putative transposase